MKDGHAFQLPISKCFELLKDQLKKTKHLNQPITTVQVMSEEFYHNARFNLLLESKNIVSNGLKKGLGNKTHCKSKRFKES